MLKKVFKKEYILNNIIYLLENIIKLYEKAEYHSQMLLSNNEKGAIKI